MGALCFRGICPSNFQSSPRRDNTHFPSPASSQFGWSTGHSQAQGNGNDKKRVGPSPFFPPSRGGDSSPQKKHLPGSSSRRAARPGLVGMKEKVFADPAKKSRTVTLNFWPWVQDPTIIFVAQGPVTFASGARAKTYNSFFFGWTWNRGDHEDRFQGKSTCTCNPIGSLSLTSQQFSNLLGTVYSQGNLLFSPDGTHLFSPVGNRVTVFNLVE